ncbi:MAG: glycosyltransferase family 2 protein [Candidatus Promineifilaceae bacterium]
MINHSPPQPFVSIVIVSWNSCSDLARCLPTLVAQQYTAYELIIVDNASDDNSAEFVQQTFPTAQIIQNHENVGFAAASNQGFAAGRGEILIGLNPDTRVASEWLCELIKPFADSHIGLTTPRIVLMDNPDQINTCGNEISLTGLTFCIGVNQSTAQFDKTTPQAVSAISGAAFAMSRACYIATGGFDPSYFTYYEDTDLSLRATLAGFSTVFVPSSIVQHDYQFRMSAHKMYWIERNRQITLLKCLRRNTLLILLPSLLFGELIAWGYAILNGPATALAKARALWWILRFGWEIERIEGSDRQIVSQMVTRINFHQAMPPHIGQRLSQLCEPFLRFNKWLAL